MIRFFLLLFASLFTSFALFADEVITTKKDEPDGYYGLKVGAILTPTFGYRVRDKASGVSDTSQSDKTGFSMPWTMLMISKEWENTGIKVEFWGEIVKSNSISADTNAEGGSKSNPHIFTIRRANVQKLWELGSFQHRLIFGMQELPHMHSVWGGYYDWRYMDRSPLESLAFSADPVDLGLSYLAQWKSLSTHIAVVNGDGYKSLQNSSNSGYDAIARISWEEKWTDELKTGLHFLGRRGNAFGYAGNECYEGKTKCLPTDNNPNTQLRGNIRLSQDQTYAVEGNVIWKQYVNLGLGGMVKKKFSGEYTDALAPTQFAIPINETLGRGAYAWLGLGTKLIRWVFRGEIANGGPNPGLKTTETTQEEPWVRLSSLNSVKDPVYSDKSYYVSKQVYWEYFFSESTRIGLGYMETRSYDSKGSPNKYYIDNLSNERTVSDYRSQFSTPSAPLISEYGKLERSFFLKANLIF
ncbi:MAG: hypothetical protein SH817_02525 [Leptospira sp.]|nr:hypothetical protein [Leptospira sp.]